MADRHGRASPNLAAAAVLAVLVVGLLAWQRPWQSDPARRDVAAIPADAASRLTTQLRGLSSARTQDEFVTSWGKIPAARELGRRAWDSLRALGATEVSLRYTTGGEVADRRDGSARMVAEVAWRPGRRSGLGADTVHHSSVAFRVVPQEDGALSIVDPAPLTTDLPIWLTGEVIVKRSSGTVVVSVDGGPERLPVTTMAATARAQVDRVLPDSRGDVVVVAPRTQEQMARIVGQEVADVRQIAAVTTRLDLSSATATGAAVVVLNPPSFTTMDRRAAQVVLTHEATHLLTGAVGTRVASWVVEGFADYVALLDDTAPVSVSAGQILAEVEAGRVPTRLPDGAAFASTGHGLGAVYESAWMAFRLLAEEHDRSEIVGFYRSVLGGTPLDEALQDSFDLTERRLTAQWRDYLTKSASTVS